MRDKVLCVLFAVALVSAAAANAQEPKFLKSLVKSTESNKTESSEVDVDADITETMNRIALAFEEGDAELLESCLVTGKRRVFFSLDAGEHEPGHYGRDQVKFMLDDVFNDVQTKSFRFDTRDLSSRSARASFRAEWTYMSMDADETVTEFLRFRLERTKEDWRIVEVRSVSR